MRDWVKTSLAVLVGASAAIPASAATVLLTFDSAPAPGACTNVDGGTANMQCTADNQFLGVDHGSTPILGITYLPGGTFVSFRVDDITNGSTDFGIKTSGNQPSSPFAQIVFTPAPGYEVSFTSLNYFVLSATSAPGIFQLLDETSTVVFDASTPSPAGNPTLDVNSAYYSGPLTFQWRSESGGLGVDDLALDVRQVPEPATLSMMLAGFGILGAASRRRRRG